MKSVLLDIKNVSLTFPGVERPALTNIDYQVLENDFIVILGSNGSGKSSLLKLLNRYYEVSSGDIFFTGKPLKQYPEKILSHSIKTLTQNCDESLFLSLTVLENYLLIKQNYQHARSSCAEYLAKFNPNLPAKLNQLVAQLSGGEKQALALALTILQPPQILLLDEHTSALDPNSAANLMQLTYQLAIEHKITCVLTTHDLSIAEKYGNRVLALRHGQIIQRIENAAKAQLDQQGLLAVCY